MKPALVGEFELTESQVNAGIKSLMVVPIILFNEMQGVICAVNAQNGSGRFEQEDLELFASSRSCSDSFKKYD